jgi:AcrR family transcriptional regulator
LWQSPEAESGVPPSFAPAAPEHKWLLAVGVGRYQNGAYTAEGAGSDARIAAAALQRHAGIPQNHVQILADEQATLANIKQAIKWLQNSTTGRDTIYLYLGGHGLNAPDPPRFRNPDGRGFALAPHDADPKDTANTLLFGFDLATWLGATRAQTIVVLADAAEAGGMNVPATPDLGRQFLLLASAGVGQRPNVARGAQASLFVEALTAGLAGGADPDRDRQVSLEELRGYVQSTVATRTGNAQTPHARAGFGVRSTPSLSFTAGG